MKDTHAVTAEVKDNNNNKDREWGRFFLLMIVVLPILTACAIGAYGLFIWIMQILFWGPPS